jgi:hypothetical protein
MTIPTWEALRSAKSLPAVSAPSNGTKLEMNCCQDRAKVN